MSNPNLAEKPIKIAKWRLARAAQLTSQQLNDLEREHSHSVDQLRSRKWLETIRIERERRK